VKYIISFALLLSSFCATAAPSEVLRCLGAEEQRLHKAKSQGPEFQLNQQLISELIQVESIDLSPTYLSLVCNYKENYPSKKLLYLLLDKGNKIFEFKHGLSASDISVGESMLEDFMKDTQGIVMSYIASIQQEAPTADCLKKNIPEMELFYIDMKYLEEEIETKYLFKDKGLAEKILNKLSNYPKLFKKCMPQPEIKKTDKSGSTPNRKKS